MNTTKSDILLETLTTRTIGEESILAMSVLLAAPVPAGVIRYMHAEISNRLAEDLLHAPHFSRVTAPAAGPDAVRDALLRHAAEQYVFPRAEFLAMLENAARFTENYLCRPRWTLSSFLFLDQPAVTAETLLRKLEYVSDYAYLPQLLRRMVTHSGKQVISSHECIAYIARIDDAVIREHSPRERALLARPIFQFFLLSPDIENKPIALRALLLFLEDKRFGPLREYIERIWQIRGKSDITMEEFIVLNEDFATGRSSFAPTTAVDEPPPEPQEPAPPAELVQGSLVFAEPPPDGSLLQNSVQQATVVDESVLRESVAAEPVHQKNIAAEHPQPEIAATEPVQQVSVPSEPAHQEDVAAEPLQPEIAASEPVQQVSAPSEPAHQEDVAAEPLQPEIATNESGPQEHTATEPAQQESVPVEPVLQEHDVAEPLQPGIAASEPGQQESVSDEPVQPVSSLPEAPILPPLPSLREMIPGGLRRRFISVICGKDAEFYDLVIARLDEMYSWPQASTYIRELFEINSIDPFNDTAIAFTDVIQKRCDQSRMAQQ
jgi:hypothetical protein